MTRPTDISDHALLRWLERRHGIDMEWMREAMRAEIEGAQEAGIALQYGTEDRWIIVIDGVQFVFEDGRCVTVLTPTMRPKTKSARGRTHVVEARH